MKQRILFLVPPHNTYEYFTNPADDVRQNKKYDGKFYGNLPTDMPLGILSMSSYLKKFVNIDVDLIDFNIELGELKRFNYDSFYKYFNDFLSNHKLKYLDYNYIGITALFTPSFYSLIDLGNISRKLYPNSIIIAGGSVPTTMYKMVFSHTNINTFNALCFGEGEKPILELIQSTNKIDYLENNLSWITLKKIMQSKNSIYQQNFIQDLDEIPFYDYDLCNFKRYGINPAISAYAPADTSNNNFHVMTSRGCPFKCAFCASHKVHGRSMRYFSMNRVKEDFKKLKEKYNATTFIFQDDHLMGDKKRALDIIKYVGKLKVPAIFQNGLAVYALDREMLQAIKNSGCSHLVLPVESGSDRVLKEVMHKPLNLSIVSRVVKDCKDLDIYVSVNILIGMPGETKDDIEDARKYLKTVGANWFIVLIASPLIGSEMYDICDTNDYLLEDNVVGSDYKKAIVETEDFEAKYIQEKMYLMNLELNFVENSDMKNKKYKVALASFNNVIKAKSDHAIAYYYASICHKELNNQKISEEYYLKALEYSKTEFWIPFFKYFNIPI